MSSKSFKRLDTHEIAHIHCREAFQKITRLLMMLIALISSARFRCVMPCPGTKHARTFEYSVLLLMKLFPQANALKHESVACR